MAEQEIPENSPKETTAPVMLQVTMRYSPVVHSVVFDSMDAARAALAKLSSEMGKGEFRNDGGVVHITHAGGEAAFKASEIAAVGITDPIAYAERAAEIDAIGTRAKAKAGGAS